MAEECSICLSPVVKETTGRVELSVCNHTFHLACIAKWMAKSDKCPNCRNTVSTMESNTIVPMGISTLTQGNVSLGASRLQQLIRQSLPAGFYIDEFHMEVENNAILFDSDTSSEQESHSDASSEQQPRNIVDTIGWNSRNIERLMSYVGVNSSAVVENLQAEEREGEREREVANAILYLSQSMRSPQ